MDQDCIKLTTFFGGHRIKGISAHVAAAGLRDARDIPASILLRGTDGCGLRRRLPVRPAASRHPECVVAAAETVATGGQPTTGAMIDRVLSPGGSRLVTARQARLLSEEIDLVGLWDDADEETRLTVYLGRQDRVFQVPAFEVICELLHRRGAAGATVLAGIDGTLRSHDGPRPAGRAAPAPMMIVAIGSGTRLSLVLPEIGDLLRHPLMTLEQVRLCKRDGQIISLPRATPQPGAVGRPLWLKLSVFAREPGPAAGPFTGPSSAACTPPASAALPCAACGDSTGSTHRTADATFPGSRPWPARPSGFRRRSPSSTSSRAAEGS